MNIFEAIREIQNSLADAHAEIARLREARDSKRGFDPLELDRFTRLQELTRIMAESVGDVQTVHQSLLHENELEIFVVAHVIQVRCVYVQVRQILC